ncbi:wall-associated receptor kinase 2-like [Wolffia australiana]
MVVSLEMSGRNAAVAMDSVSRLLLILLSISSVIAEFNGVLPGCPDRCGDIAVPYPFGIAPNCYRPGFKLTCDKSSFPPKLLLASSSLQVSSIGDSLLVAQVPISRSCYDPTVTGPNVITTAIDVSGTPFTVSSERNKLNGIGCDTLALSYQGTDIYAQSRGCISLCNGPSFIANGTCEGAGCCQTSIPQGLQQLSTSVGALRNHTATFNFSPCSFAFIADIENFTFRLTDLQSFRVKSTVAAVLNWAVGKQSCATATQSVDFACGSNSVCVNATEGPGYGCRCSVGYQGNPYLDSGCQDIDECADPSANPCSDICHNLPGTYTCSCPKGRTGDGKKAGKGCVDSRRVPLLQIILGVGLGTALLIATGSWAYWALKKRRMILLREDWFKQNGGMMLRQHISSFSGRGNGAKLFTATELEKATDGYSEARILGKGGHGTVYKGVLPGDMVVAIKRSKVVGATEVEQFINELVILSQIDHPNVVKILGCCLETEVPLLVYEYVSNGSLSRHLHEPTRKASLSWEIRLRVAAETAAALAHLHSATAQPIIHRDVKAANILLDEGFTAKVSDFGASRLIPLGKRQVMTLIQGTMGYLDPEYFQTGLLMESSDVYSFGVVMAELLTGQEPLCEKRPQGEQNLAIYFLRALRSGRISDVLERRVRNEARWEQLEAVAMLAGRCLSVKGEDRPSMKEVAADLMRLRVSAPHPWALRSPQRWTAPLGKSKEGGDVEEDSLLKDARPPANYSGDSNSYNCSSYMVVSSPR